MLHRHPKTDETFFVLEGDLTMYVDGKLSTLHHGDMAYVPKMTVPNENSISEKNR
jgi:mannose-6-phosphate isomerase-like protein (cupin superfamily)